MSKYRCYVILFFIFLYESAGAQHNDSLLTEASLEQCVQYALSHQSTIKQSLLDQQIAETEIRTRLSEWFPQIDLNYAIERYFKVPAVSTTIVANNLSTAYFSLSQNIFNPDVILASRTAGNVRLQTKQITENTKIYLVLNVSKAFYNVLLSQQQINLVDQDITRLSRTVKDAFNQYKAGVVDKTDYKRAQITLNNSMAEKKQYQEAFNAQFSVLKLLMGYPQPDSFHLVYDSIKQQQEIYLDTLQQVSYTNRVEYKILETQRSLLQANVQYNKLQYLPTISAFGDYNFVYANNSFGKLYQRSYPSSYAGLTLSFPIFQGGRRVFQLRGANLQLDRLQYDFTTLRDSIQSEYTQALANYKSNLNDYYTQHDNLDLANDVYNTVYLQYKSGIITYLSVIIAESDLRTTQVNYLNALYQVLSSKLDVEKAMGNLTF